VHRSQDLLRDSPATPSTSMAATNLGILRKLSTLCRTPCFFMVKVDGTAFRTLKIHHEPVQEFGIEFSDRVPERIAQHGGLSDFNAHRGV